VLIYCVASMSVPTWRERTQLGMSKTKQFTLFTNVYKYTVLTQAKP
jgi:hypothetical protein